jgi:hypothetical protein
MKLYKQLIVLPYSLQFIACMQGNKSEKAITETQVTMKQPVFH